MDSLPLDVLTKIVFKCASPLENETYKPAHPPLAPHCLWGPVDAMLTLIAIVATCKTLRASVSTDAWEAACVLSLPSYASAKVCASRMAMVKAKMLRALLHRPLAPPVQDSDGVVGIWPLLDVHDQYRAPWMAPKAAIAYFQAMLGVDLPKDHSKKQFHLTDCDLINLVPRLKAYCHQSGRKMVMQMYNITDIQRVARRKHLGEGAVKLTHATLRQACNAIGVDADGSVSKMKLRVHEAIDVYGQAVNDACQWLESRQRGGVLDYDTCYGGWIVKSVAVGLAPPPSLSVAHEKIVEDDLTFFAPIEKRNRLYKYGARVLCYRLKHLRQIFTHKVNSRAKVLNKRQLRALCSVLKVPTKTALGTSITKRQMLVRARLAIDPNGRITRNRERVAATM